MNYYVDGISFIIDIWILSHHALEIAKLKYKD